MKHFILERFCYSPMGTFGRILTFPLDKLYTIELPWQNNEREKSCIPQGTYICQRFKSEKHPNTFQVMNVPARSGILFHVGNTSKDFQGCIGVGTNLGNISDRWAVIQSKEAFTAFMSHLEGVQEFRLTITQYKP